MLENACFACSDNEAHLAAVAVRVGGNAAGGGRELPLTEWLAQQLEVLGQQGLSTGFKKVKRRGWQPLLVCWGGALGSTRVGAHSASLLPFQRRKQPAPG